ncbi:hypothetical protein IE53DRAFT_383332 [Violaceomyces palustris]|uniref:Uncharacterized protein n=1 Tax=Violaceomyces palustris TaxID=1673888 RepID=A0ACD0P817_9BASI|nr:hypothetical protein IE53DRAFT_383332 [Violaceomyces palustris]
MEFDTLRESKLKQQDQPQDQASTNKATNPDDGSPPWPMPPATEPSQYSDQAETINSEGDQSDTIGEEPSSSSSSSSSSPPPPPPHNLLFATEQLESSSLPKPFSQFNPAPTLRLDSIRIVGAESLRPSFLQTLCRPYVDPSISFQNSPNSSVNRFLYGERVTYPLPNQTTTLKSILALTSNLANDLDRLDVFSNIDAQIVPSLEPGFGNEGVDVVLNCRKKGRVFLKSSTDLGNGEGSASIQGRVRNLFGGCETLQGSATFGTRTKQSFNLEFSLPLLSNPDHTLSVSAFATDRDQTSFASCYENLKGLRASVSSNKGLGMQNELAYECSLSSLGRLLPDASISIRKLARRPTVKSSISHTLLRDTRDDPLMPSRGSYFKMVQEYAGLGGDSNFFKAEFESSIGRRWELPFPPQAPTLRSVEEVEANLAEQGKAAEGSSPAPLDETLLREARMASSISTNVSFRTGLMRTLNGSGSLFTDRYQVGGPTCVRMFRLNGLGPKDKFDSLGGDAFWTAGASILSPVPFKPHWPLKLQAFFNAGQVSQIDMAKPLMRSENFSELLQPSASFGLGLVYLQGPLRVELNAGLPLLTRKGDSSRKGLQLGVGINFL